MIQLQKSTLKQLFDLSLRFDLQQKAAMSLPAGNSNVPEELLSPLKVDDREKMAVLRWSMTTHHTNFLGTVSVRRPQWIVKDRETNGSYQSLDPQFERMWSIRFSPAWWMSSCNWQHTFRQYRTVSTDSAIFGACCDGDLGYMQKLLTEGSASLFDIDEDGLTLLHVRHS